MTPATAASWGAVASLFIPWCPPDSGLPAGWR